MKRPLTPIRKNTNETKNTTIKISIADTKTEVTLQ